ncbi:MAG: hypothetical protein GWN79_23060, partial [Actinobacteria bacterium]|nr:hypothetical protein [Actinomycetota bacterium]NIS35440.1 hypothetical protein [Actinomycetota bacterium]NIT98132.1 hypothetical protein [Actinomycetota bacterium]NIU21760.1 hypothetical protein [Actinomycetota bacterium]NIU70120.1 hypothetical protein [Actinomycetota bacterium]
TLEIEYGSRCPEDLDGDGATCDVDCDDGDPDVHPGAEELCDGRDNDCDGSVDEGDASDAVLWFADLDRDGFGDPASATPACQAPPGWVDTAGDCDDLDDLVRPGGTDLCDGFDNDCDGTSDEDFEPRPTTCGVGVCAGNVGTTRCEAGRVVDGCDALAGSAPDDALCNGLDDDCDGSVDEDYLPPATSCGVGTCAASGLLECVSGWLIDTCQSGIPAPADVLCNDLDDDCDGSVDETTWRRRPDAARAPAGRRGGSSAWRAGSWT